MDYVPSNKFRGTLSSEASSVDVAFSARIDDTGELHLEFDPIPIDEQSIFIETHWDPPGHDLGEFHLVGTADDGTAFDTADLIFNRVGRNSTMTGGTFHPSASCSEARLKTHTEGPDGPVAKLPLKGVRAMCPLEVQTRLGSVHLYVPRTLDPKASPDAMSGRLQVNGGADIVDVHAWRAEVNQLLDHVLNIMSFASGTMLRTPLTEFIHDGRLELVALSQTRQESSYMPPFSHLALEPIFLRAVETYFKPAVPVDKLHYAIAWYCMNSSYVEANLITAMTVLENLISSNLSDEDILIQTPAAFEKLRKKISGAAKDHFADVTEDTNERQLFVDDVNGKLNDINRRTLKQKIHILAGRWSMSLEGVTDKQIQDAKKARDSIVHRGSYEHIPGKNAELFEHLIIARELVVRFILTILHFDGTYRSYIGGMNDRTLKLASQTEPSE